MKIIFFREIFEKYSKINFMKIHSVRGELFHADGRADGSTDMTKLIVTFRNFAKTPKKPMR